MEEQFKRKLSIVKVDWDKEQLWEELEPKLPTKSRKFPWFVLLLFVIASFGMALWLYESVPDTSSNTQLLEGSNLELDGQTDGDILNQKLETAISSVEATEPSEVEAQIPNRSQIGFNQNAQPTQSKHPKPIFSLINDTKQATLTKDTSTAQPNHFSIIRDTSTITYTEKSLVGTTQNRAFSFSNTGNIKPLLSLPDALSFRVKSNSKALPELEQIPEAGMQQHPGFFLDIIMGGGQPSRSVHFMEQNVDVLPILEKNKAAEKPFLLMGVDLGLGYQLKSGVFIKSGLQYRRIQEHLDWENASTTSSFLPDYEKAFFELRPGGDTLFYSGPVEAQSIETREVFHKNNITIFNIPLEVGFEKKIRRVQFNVFAGGTLGLTTKFTGRVVDLGNEILDYSQVNLDNRIGYYFGLGVGYVIKPKSSIFLAANYEQSPTFLINQAKQDYRSLNIQFGVKTYLRR